jgi:hypothetical protein
MVGPGENMTLGRLPYFLKKKLVQKVFIPTQAGRGIEQEVLGRIIAYFPFAVI